MEGLKPTSTVLLKISPTQICIQGGSRDEETKEEKRKKLMEIGECPPKGKKKEKEEWGQERKIEICLR